VKEVVAYSTDRGRVPAQTRFLEDGETFTFGELEVRTFHIPGHTLGAVAYFVRSKNASEAPAVFTGDTMFLAGCGRLFEGTPAQMHKSLSDIAALPPNTRVYCGHEYTESNLRFAAHVEPSNAAIKRAQEAAAKTRAAGEATVPGTLEAELLVNPFLRTGSEEIRKTLGIAAQASGAEALGVIRKAKDSF
jgi:hydroxyacylglutathione hydrolase